MLGAVMDKQDRPLFPEVDLTDRQVAALDTLWSLAEWPQDYETDRLMLRNLGQMYPGIDLAGEALSWVTWFTEKYRKKHPRKAVVHRSRFTNWCKNADRWDKQTRIRSGIKHRRPGTMEEHGGEGNKVIEGW